MCRWAPSSLAAISSSSSSRRLPARSLVAELAAALNVAGVLVVDSRRPDRAVVVLVISPVRALVAGCGLLLLHTVNHDDAVGTAKIGDILLSMEETDGHVYS